MEQTSDIFAIMLGSDNNARLQLEEKLELEALNNTETLTITLLNALDSSDEKHIELASLLLHKKVLSKNEAFKKLSPELIKSILDKVVSAVKPERKFTFLKRAAEIIVQLYVNQDQYMGFFELIQKYEGTTDEKIKQFVLYNLELLAEFSFEQELLVQNAE